MLKAEQHVTFGVEHAYVAQAGAVIFIFRSGTAVGVGDDDIPADVLNAERNEIRR